MATSPSLQYSTNYVAGAAGTGFSYGGDEYYAGGDHYTTQPGPYAYGQRNTEWDG